MYTPMDLHMLRRAMAQKPVDTEKVKDNTLKLMLSQFDPTTDSGYQVIDKFVSNNTELLEAVFKMSAIEPPPELPKHDEPKIYVPDLPKAAQLTDEALKQAESVGQWFKLTSSWAKENSPMTPPHFLEGATLWLAGLAIARRAYIHLHERIYPHLYFLIVAETSRFAKSTGMNLFYHIILQTMPYMLIPGSVTTEGMIELLSGHLPSNYDKLPAIQKDLISKGKRFAGQRGIILDEYSSLLAAGKKDYMQGFVELLLKLYDAREKEHHYTKSAGWLTIDKPALSIFGATTPAAMGRSVTKDAWEDGNMARYLIMYREDVMDYNETWSDTNIPEEITKPLLKVHNGFPSIASEFDEPKHQSIAAMMQPETITAYRAYAKAMRHDLLEDADQRVWGNYTRLHVQAVKLALSLATMDALGNGEKNIWITAGHWAIAQQITERSRHNIHDLLVKINESKDARNQRDILALLRNNPGGLTVRDICRMTSSYANDIRQSLDILIEAGDVEEIEHIPPTGRPTKFYKSFGYN